MCIAILIVAWLALIVGIVWGLFYPYYWKSAWRARRGYVFIISLAFSVLCLVVAYVVGESKGFGVDGIVDAIATFLQFFSLDAEYTCIAAAAEKVVPSAPWLFGGLTAIETFLAPVAGACFIGQLIYSFIPRLWLWLNWKRTKFVFSELNERSITLAEDIARLSWEIRRWHCKKYPFVKENIDFDQKKWLKSSCIVFTDAYTDKEAETSSELLARAKRIGAICLKDDILERPLHFLFFWKKKIVYFLIDQAEENNLTSAIALLTTKRTLWKRTLWESKNIKVYKDKIENGGGSLTDKELDKAAKRARKQDIKQRAEKECEEKIKISKFRMWIKKVLPRIIRTDRMEMYVFTSSTEAERLLHKALQDEYARVGDSETVLVKCVNECRNIVYKMFDDKKLLDGLISDKVTVKQRDLYKVWTRYSQDNAKADSAHTIRIVILGGGKIAKEYFKTAAWCCKMSLALQEKQLEKIEILVFAKNAKAFEASLRAETTLRIDTDSADCAKTALRFSTDSVDCFAEFIEAEFPSSEFDNAFRDKIFGNSLPVQRFLVAFGDDRLNHEAARWIRDGLGKRYGVFAADAPPAIIDFAVENEEFLNTLKAEYETPNKRAVLEAINEWCLMRPFGAIKECFLFSNIRMDALERRAMEADRVHRKQETLFDKKQIREFLNGWEDYFRGSSVAVAIHTLYKYFCQAVNEEGEQKGLYEWMKLSEGGDFEKKLESWIYWLEHCRWLTYMRTCGYRCPTAKEFIAMVYDENGIAVRGKHKDSDMRLHACMLAGNGENHSLEELKNRFCADLEAVGKLKINFDEIKRSGSKDLELAAWLENTIFPKDEKVDALDRLNLLMVMTLEKKEGEKFQEDGGFKEYDINISRELYRQILRQQCAKSYEAYEKEKKNNLVALRESLMKLLQTWPREFQGEIEVASEGTYKLLLVTAKSHWVEPKIDSIERVDLSNERSLIAISCKTYEKHKDDNANQHENKKKRGIK